MLLFSEGSKKPNKYGIIGETGRARTDDPRIRF